MTFTRLRLAYLVVGLPKSSTSDTDSRDGGSDLGRFNFYVTLQVASVAKKRKLGGYWSKVGEALCSWVSNDCWSRGHGRLSSILRGGWKSNLPHF